MHVKACRKSIFQVIKFFNNKKKGKCHHLLYSIGCFFQFIFEGN